MSNLLNQIFSEVQYSKNHGVLIRLIQELPKAHFNFWSKNFNDCDFPSYYAACEMYVYNKHKQVSDKFEISLTSAFIPHLLKSRKLERVVLDTFEKTIRHFVLIDENNILYRGQFDTFEDSESFALHIYGPSLNFLELTKEFSEFKKQKNDSTIEVGLVKLNQSGYNIGYFDIPKPTIDVELNYGSKFYSKDYPTMVKKLNKDRNKVYLFSGLPGTGKSFFIKHLIGEVDRKFIYLSDAVMAGGLDNPNIIELVSENRGAVLVIEDAEKYITSRDVNANSLVSSLLNLSDGILSDILGFSIILTHNMENLDDIDKALLRKGRLGYSHNFQRLSVADAQKKLDSLGVEHKVTKDMSLAEIYCLEEETGHTEKEKRRMGF